MNSSDYRVTALLTEHLGFEPLTLIDEVINAVNQIMYNCTDALEAFLKKRRVGQLSEILETQGKASDDAALEKITKEEETEAERSGKVFLMDEIQQGTAELETLLVSHVDKNFDKFELYTLRNILTIPKDLVEGGWLRLKHQEGLAVPENPADPALAGDLNTLVKNINLELQLRKILKVQLVKAKAIIKSLTLYKQCADAMILANTGSKLSPETTIVLKENLAPLNENVYFLLGQVGELIGQMSQLNEKLLKNDAGTPNQTASRKPSARDAYLFEKSKCLLEMAGVLLHNARGGDAPTVLYSAFALEQKPDA